MYGEGNTINSIGVFSESLGYDSHGNVTSVTRHGKNSSSTYGVMDNLTLTYDGNRLAGVSETVADYDFAGSFEYRRANGSQYIYNANGSLVADRSRGIAYITYDANGNPARIYFTNGNVTKYKYSASGQKLGVEYYVAVPNVMVPFGAEPDALTQGQVMYAGSTQYLLGGSLVVKDGMTDKLLFDGGYAKAIFVNPTTYTFKFYYYNKDHLGNIREVVDSAGTVKQVTNYYPFGAPYADPTAVLNANMQPYKYNGKELDRMHGLDTYDYGARQYDPVLGRWDRMDPLCEKYYDVSPYVYCENNPVNRIDPDGKGSLETFIFSIKHPIISDQIGLIHKYGSNISSTASRFAGIARTEGNINAIRHTVWQAIITRRFGYEIAKEVGDAHEINPNTSLSQRVFFGSDAKEASDQVADLLNNNIGREIGKSYTGNIKELVSFIFDFFYNKGLYVNEEDKSNNSYRVIRKKISQKEKNDYENKLRSRNEKGFTEDDIKEIKKKNQLKESLERAL